MSEDTESTSTVPPEISSGPASTSEERTPASRSGALRPVLAVLGMLGIMLGLVAWAASSPVGASPDEDYHLASIWCPRPIESSGCQFTTDNGVITSVSVPEVIAEAQACLGGSSGVGSYCIDELSETETVRTERFDNGAYPAGYYQLMRVFVGSDVDQSVFNMRVFNGLLGISLLVLCGALSTSESRRNLILASVVALVPMGVFFVASVNPSSWSITGVLVYGVSLYSAIERNGWRRGALLGLSLLGAAMAVMSRGDASFFLLVVTLVIWILVPVSRSNLRLLVISGAIGAIGAANALSTGQGGNLQGSGGWPIDLSINGFRVFVENIATWPEHVGRYWGLVSWGGPWLDIPVTGWSTIPMVMLAGGLIFAGFSVMSHRKGLALAILSGAFVGIPIVSMTLRHVVPLQQYHGRYMLPLLSFLFFVLLVKVAKRPVMIAPAQVWLLTIVASIANGFALQRVLRMHLMGVDGYVSLGFPRFLARQWWPWQIAPEVVLWGGALAFAVGLGLLLAAVGALSSRASQVTTPHGVVIG